MRSFPIENFVQEFCKKWLLLPFFKSRFEVCSWGTWLVAFQSRTGVEIWLEKGWITVESGDEAKFSEDVT